MKKTIAALLLVSSNSFAEAKVMAQPKDEFKTVCLQSYTNTDGSMSASDCDSSRNNETDKLKIAKNGCAQGQVAIRIRKSEAISACFPSGVVQL